MPTTGRPFTRSAVHNFTLRVPLDLWEQIITVSAGEAMNATEWIIGALNSKLNVLPAASVLPTKEDLTHLKLGLEETAPQSERPKQMTDKDIHNLLSWNK